MLSYRKLAMRVLGRPLHTGDSGSPRPASQRAAAFILTAIMLTSLTAPALDVYKRQALLRRRQPIASCCKSVAPYQLLEK